MTLWLSDKPLVLASQSKVRRALIEAAGIPVETRPAHLDERAIEQGVTGGPGEVALTLAREKARTVAAMSGPASWSAATRPWRSVNGDSPSRPTAPRRARSCMAMRGKPHELHSAVAVCRNGTVTFGSCGGRAA